MNLPDLSINDQQTVTLFVKVAAKATSVGKAREALLADVHGARTEEGNLKMELYQADGEPDHFYLFERWKNQAELENHFAQPYTAGAFDLQKADLTAPIEMDYLTDLWPVTQTLQRQSHRRLTTLIVPFEVKQGREDAFISLFRTFVPMVRKEAGNMEFHFHRVNGSNTRFVLYERWGNQFDLDAHNASPATAQLLRDIAPILTRPVGDFLLFAKDIS